MNVHLYCFFTGMFTVSSAIDGSEISSQMFREIFIYWRFTGTIGGGVLSIAALLGYFRI